MSERFMASNTRGWIRCGLRTAVAGATAALALAATATAATTVHPAGGSGFDADAEGWTGSATSCTLPLICTASNGYQPDGGSPGGAIATTADVAVSLVGLFEATGTWTSPPFTLPAGSEAATFQYDRRFDSAELLDLDPSAEIVVELVDDTAGTATTLFTDTIGGPEPEFTTHGVGAPGAAIAGGHTYRLRLTSTIASSSASVGLLGGEVTLAFDDVGLAVSDSPGGGSGGGGTPNVSGGVTIVHGPYTDAEIADIIGRFGVDVEGGHGRGGSLIPLELCTIVGTPGADRITGTSGNDVICGLGGDDVVFGAGGRDAIDGANGRDRLTGATGGDLLLGLRGGDRLAGVGGADRLGAGSGRDRASGGNGRDLVSGASGPDRVRGAAGGDRLRGRAGSDRIEGGAGPDRIDGGGGRDRVMGGPGRDRLAIRDGRRDRASGGPNRDVAQADRFDRVRRVGRVARR